MPNRAYVLSTPHVDISGVPGIGKTLSVKKVLELYKDRDECKKNKGKFLSLNGMHYKQQADIYKGLYNG